MPSPTTPKKRNETYYRSIFDKYDRDGSGTIDVQELADKLREDNEIPDKLVKKLIAYNDRNNDGQINVDEFIDMVRDKKFQDLFGHYVRSYVNYIVPRDKRHRFKQVGRKTGGNVELGLQEPDGAYEDGFSYWPPPVCMILLSIFETTCFILNASIAAPDESANYNDAYRPVALVLMYHPKRRYEAWRFVTYMLVHIGWLHLAMNLMVQVVLGLALELVNRWWRVLTVYVAGVAAGSLMTSICDPTVYLAGASGGVYALFTAHLANIAINWAEMSCPAVQLIIFSLFVTGDLGNAFYQRYKMGDQTPIGYAAHFGGALAGLLVGIWVLTNVEPTENEKYLWWVAFVIFLLLLGLAIILNLFWTGHFVPTDWS